MPRSTTMLSTIVTADAFAVMSGFANTIDRAVTFASGKSAASHASGTSQASAGVLIQENKPTATPPSDLKKPIEE